MKVLRIIVQIAILFVYYYAGVAIVSMLSLPFPGSIIGLLLLALSLHFKIIKVQYIQDGAGFLLAMLTLFFIPSTVGIIEYPELLTVEGLLALLSVTLSTIVAIFVTGKISRIIEQKEQSEDSVNGGER